MALVLKLARYSGNCDSFVLLVDEFESNYRHIPG